MDINYESLFGALDFKKGDEARSVYAPAAYLADLLQLLDDYFEEPDLVQRRSDLREIPLDKEHTYSLLSYLEIVNELLEKRGNGTSFAALKKQIYPLHLPFNLDQEKTDELLKYSKVSMDDIYKLFSLQASNTEIARLSLQLSSELLAQVVQAEPESVPALYGLKNNKELQALRSVHKFMQRTSIDGKSLRALLFQQIASVNGEAATQFFTNNNLGGYAALDEQEENIIWKSTEMVEFVEEGLEEMESNQSLIPEQWFARANRLLRLSKASSISIEALDIILRNCCDHQLNERAIERIAVIQSMAKRYDLAIEEVCSLFAPMDTLNVGNGPMAGDLFNRIFNKDASVDGRYFQIGERVPPQLSGLKNAKAISWTADLSGAANLYARKRIAKALQISTKDLQRMIDRLVEPFMERMDIQPDEALSHHNALLLLSMFHRVAKCAQLQDLSIKEYFELLDMIEGDATIRKVSNFHSLIPIAIGTGEAQTMDINAILINGNPAETFWLIPLVDAIASWLQTTPLSTSDLMEVLQAQDLDSKAGKAYLAKKIKGLNNVYQQLKPGFLEASLFESERFNQRAARLIFEGMTSENSAVVVRAAGKGQGSANNKIIKGDKENIQKAAEQIISDFQRISTKDFMHLGIEEKMQHKIFNNMIIKGFIKPDGTIIKAAIPANMEAFSINNSSLSENETLFDVIHQLFEHEVGNGNGNGNGHQNFTAEQLEPGDFVLFQSDLDILPVDKTRKAELYDNLIFNGYIDEEGLVLDPEFFAHTSNKSKFDANAHIATYSPKVYKLIQQKMMAYQQDQLKLEASTFTGLGLKEIEVMDLLENLRFNEYLNENNALLDKAKMETLKLEDFKLALPFYPFRRQILERIQNTLLSFKTKYFVLAENELNTIAQEIVADLVHQHLTEHFLEEGRLTEESMAFFEEDSNVAQFQLGKYFDQNTQLIVFKAVNQIIDQFQPYQMLSNDLQSEGFSEAESMEVISLLQEKGYLQTNATLSKTQAAFFLNINNALVLEIPEYEDFSKDIFFVLHNLAKETNAAVEEITAMAMNVAAYQKEILLNALQELLEMPADWIEVVANQVFPGQQSIVETFVAPLLHVVNSDGMISELPAIPKFNRAYDRMQQFARLSGLLGLNAMESEIIFRDQNLAQKFPEPLQLPDGLDRFDFIVKMMLPADIFEAFELERDREALMLYSAPDRLAYFYDSHTYALLGSSNELEKLIPELKEQTIDAAFNDRDDNTWLIAGSDFYFCEKGKSNWTKREKTIGKVKSNFTDLKHIDASFVDSEGKIFLFAGDQYLRCSDNLENPDPGYPKRIKGNLIEELHLQLPESYETRFDAAFQDSAGGTYFFKGDHFIHSGNLQQELKTAGIWAKVKNNLAKTNQLDATLRLNDKVYLFSGDQVMTWSHGLEHADGMSDEGSIQSINALIPNLPEAFEDGIDSIFKGFDDKIHVFRKNNYIRCSLDFMMESEGITKVTEEWAKLRNQLQETGKVSAAFSGLDGCAYLFSGDQFYRYSGMHFSFVDEGYPKKIAGHWGGLKEVDAAFVLDGKTYLFGKNAEDQEIHVRYSTNDYSMHDEGFPKDAQDNWWEMHFNLKHLDFNKPDTVFWDDDGSTYLFKDKKYIQYNHLRRWWSEPKDIKKTWKALKGNKVDAAFTAKNGQTYLFAGDQVYRYTDAHFQKVDDRFPKLISDHWGKVKNTIHDKKQIDASLVLSTSETKKTAWEMTTVNYQLTFLFSGNQYVRYSGDQYDTVDEGYPKRISYSLKEEPGFSHLAQQFSEGIDAAFADQRNIYLFSQGEAQVISMELGRLYSQKLGSPISNLFQEHGMLYIESQEGWQMLNQVEGSGRRSYTSSPLTQYEVPTIFQSQLTAALRGTDDNLYLFKDGKCYNDHLEKAYPIREEWGKIRNNILDNERIDAAFVGRDGKTYVFSGDQFVTYLSKGEASIYEQNVEGLPMSVAAHWKGLDNVQLAFVKEDKTYLFEAADENGRFRYLCYSGESYEQPDGAPQVADISWWGFPEAYLEDGFTQVRGVIFDDDNMYLLSDSMFIQFNYSENVWNYPRPIERIWLRADEEDTDMEYPLTAAFKANDGNTYFCSENRFVNYQDFKQSSAKWAKIKGHWGQVKNNIVQKNRIDAAVVVDEHTYLFSGDQYVRYSGKDYRMVDEGYPKNILESLRKEERFMNLPEQFESTLEAVLQDNGHINAAAADERNVYLFIDTDLIVASKAADNTFGIQRLSRLKNNIKTTDKVDAAFMNTEGQTFLFSGDQYVRYSDSDYQMVDEGYPKSIRHYLQQFNVEVPLLDFNRNLDAALQSKNGQIYLFKGEQVFHPGWPQGKAPIEHKLNLEQQAFRLPVDAAITDPMGCTYFFKGNQFIKYSDFAEDYIDEAYPKSIQGYWGNLPDAFSEGIDGAFVFEDRTYLSKGDQHVRYSNGAFHRMDDIYPQSFKYRWTDWNDYLLNDIQLILAFKQLNDQSESEQQVSDLLSLEKGYIKKPYELLAEMFDWDIDQVKWIKQQNAFLKAEKGMEVHFNIELILQMQKIFALAEKLGITPQALYQEIYWTAFDQQNWARTAEQLYQNLALNHSEQDWQQIAKELRNTFNTLKHQALLPYVIAMDDTVEDARDLFANMLIDVEMGSEAQTSRIKEATAALQLYVHRFFTNLETGKLKGTEEEQPVKLEQLKSWWKWMKNYRVWEANRKVFLYPENYIRPELRDTKTPEFKQLEETLLSGNIDQTSVTKAYNDYLNQFATIGNLKISGANVYRDPKSPEDQILILFGYTKTDPQQYFYRTAKFLQKGKILWNNWEKLSISMRSSRVFPVYAFGRILVFWSEIEDYEESNATIVNNKSTSTVNNKDKVLKHRADIKYSFYDFNNQWINPQTLKKDVELDYKIEAAFNEGDKIYAFSGKYCMVSSKDNPEGEVREIKQVFPKLNEYFHQSVDAVAVFEQKKYWFKGSKVALENGPPQPIKNHFRNEDTDIYAHFDAKFPFYIRYRPIPLYHPPQEYHNGVAAAFVQDKTFCLIDQKGGFTFYTKKAATKIVEPKLPWIFDPKTRKRLTKIAALIKAPVLKNTPPVFESNADTLDLKNNHFWIAFLKVITNQFLKLDPVDAIFKDSNDVLYFLRNGMYDCYIYDKSQTDKSKQFQKVEGFPKPIRGNLSFNMDKFFNRLHVVRSEDELGEFVYLSYVTPKEGSLLLNGRISADFKFTEGDLRRDFDLYDTLQQETAITSKTLKYDPNIHEEAKGLLDGIKTSAEGDVELKDLKLFESSLTKFRAAIFQVGEIVDANKEKKANKRSVSESAKAIVDTNATQALNDWKEIESSDHSDMALELTESFKALQNALTTFAGSRSDDNLDTLSEAKTASNTVQGQVNLASIRNSIKATLSAYRDPAKEVVDKNITYHKDVHESYLSQIQYIDRTIENYERKFGKHPAKKGDKVAKEIASFKKVKAAYQPLVDSYGKTLKKYEKAWSASSHRFDNPLTTGNLDSAVKALVDKITATQTDFTDLDKDAGALDKKRSSTSLNNLHELYFGKFDLFPTDFHITTDANFTFSEPDWYVFEAKKGTFLCKPKTVMIDEESTGTKYDIIRLTTTTIPAISNRLFSGGIKDLLTLDTQQLDERPYFKAESNNVTASGTIAAETITYNPKYIDKHPVATTLDYDGANKNYYWEMFFHAPFLVAQSLNTAQKFEDAKEWYEYIFDPTNKKATWQFLPLQKGLLSNIDFPADLQEYITQEIDISDLEAEMHTYLNDPFDPHAIAQLREIAYKKAIVMRYIDNLLDWGDMLFGQYTMESINEARMFYIMAYDLLGKKPESLGQKILTPTKRYRDLKDETTKNDLLLKPTVMSVAINTPNESVASPYFFIPSNTLFHDYWNRVEDRLFKIRNSLNIDGIKQALPLFQPPIDPMSIVQAVGSGASLAQALGSLQAPVPHFRFRFMVQKAKELVAKLNQFSSELIAVLEKKDAEEISLLQNKQEMKIRTMMTKVREAQLEEARENINALNASLELVKANKKYNEDTVNDGMLPLEILQLTTMGISVGAHTAAVILKILAAVTAPIPQIKVGIDAGPEAGGKQVSKPFSEASEAVQSAAEGLSILGEMFGISAQHQRMMADTQHAADTAIYDIQQIESQLKGAEIQVKMAEYELAIHEKELEHQESINTFMQNKFSNKALYQWMSGKLSAMYYQTYKMALDLAKSAEKAYQFERGVPAKKVNFINGMYWDSQRKGLLAGDQLGLDIERMEQAFMQSDKRRLEITKSITLLELDPRAFLELKSKGVCEFEFSEAFFDYDFPGHYGRQVKTIAISFESPQTINATLTQLSNKMVMEPDKKAVKFLLDPKDSAPMSIRSNWRPAQQIALSHIEEYEQGNGLFELRFDDDKYLPFEGTGAVSRWRLELNGKRGSIRMEELANLTIKLKYTALQGGELFKDAVKGLLKPYFTTQYFSVADDFYDSWVDWLGSDAPELRLQMTQDRFPNMASSKITGIFARFETSEDSKHSFTLNDDENSVLKSEQFTLPSGLTVSSRGSEWILTHKGDKTKLSNLLLVVGYKAKV